MKKLDNFLDKVAEIILKVIIITVLILIAYHLRKTSDLHRVKYIMEEFNKNKISERSIKINSNTEKMTKVIHTDDTEKSNHQLKSNEVESYL